LSVHTDKEQTKYKNNSLFFLFPAMSSHLYPQRVDARLYTEEELVVNYSITRANVFAAANVQHPWGFIG